MYFNLIVYYYMFFFLKNNRNVYLGGRDLIILIGIGEEGKYFEKVSYNRFLNYNLW